MQHIFIINTSLGNISAARNIREELQRLSHKYSFDYLVFNTEYAGHETALVAQMEEIFSDEVVRFYCCGGMGTFSNMLAGVNNLKSTQLAFYPCGISCDLLKIYGSKRRFFYSLENLILGEVTRLDIIETGSSRTVNNIVLGAGVNFSVFMNAIRQKTAIFSPLAYSGVNRACLLFDGSKEYEISIDGVPYNDAYRHVFIANGGYVASMLSPCPNANPFDGILDFMLLKDFSTFKIGKVFHEYMKGDVDALSEVAIILRGKSFKITLNDGRMMTFIRDGETEKTSVISGSVKSAALNFVIPQLVIGA